MSDEITIIGGGLAGCEAAYQIARRGCKVSLFEMKPKRFSPAHSLDTLSELVCSNSLKSNSLENASGLLKEEMRILGSLIIKAAEATQVPAGQTLAVDRVAFSNFITDRLKEIGVNIIRQEVTSLPEGRPLIIATGPLTSDAFADCIKALVGSESLNFYDAVAPIVYKESINMDKAFKASRYNKGGDDYINCPFTKEEYERFYSELIAADKVRLHEFEDMASFESCMPIEVMAQRGPKTLLFGPMRPVGLDDPRTGIRPHAVVQLRRENREDTLYNIVGFQTRLTFPEQKRIFRMIPGLENAEFARLGKLHRNSYIDSPRLLTNSQQLRAEPRIFFAGQITGVEGYCESSVSGLLAGINAARILKGKAAVCPPNTTITGALMNHISDEPRKRFEPMNANMGLLPPLKGKDRREQQARKALEDLKAWAIDCLETGNEI
ncbi:MAG: methylenetetrahydrofolate--tRNA-(uracil(54)-C(5))-methyltransferase (FADH(2)-oxidizing) TrmFO [Deltaproteobacteria bacterium]|nr:methylenetetrahydrofolate--tRNA-(uracil(54)-C(5))-methyltransferase (FADH(2)-oxidizing) TrmFO [Deltaproteobacteria bacterium]